MHATVRQLDDSERQLRRVVRRARSAMAAGRFNAAAAHGEAAALHATWQHAGRFADGELEWVLRTAGRQMAGPELQSSRVFRSADMHRVLHVATLSGRYGGASRLLWRWVEADDGRQHDVVLTAQGGVAVPDQLRSAVAGRGGRVTLLDREASRYSDRARLLRGAAASADVVVVHQETHDALPLMALSSRHRPPTAYVDNADHVFWVGVSMADVVVHLRGAGASLGISRRGVAPERSAILPILLGPVPRQISSAELRQRLGIPADAVVLLTVARGVKYETRADDHLVDLMLPVLERFPQVTLVAVGPIETERWRRAREAVAGRVHALGPRDDTGTFYEIADVYVDSYPLTSITSLLEAGQHQVPLVSYCPPPRSGTVLAADAPGLTRSLIRAGSPHELAAEVSHLVMDTAYRRERGAQARGDVEREHTGEGWRRRMESVLDQLAGTPRLDGDAWRAPDRQTSEIDQQVATAFAQPVDIFASTLARMGRPSTPRDIADLAQLTVGNPRDAVAALSRLGRRRARA